MTQARIMVNKRYCAVAAAFNEADTETDQPLSIL